MFCQRPQGPPNAEDHIYSPNYLNSHGAACDLPDQGSSLPTNHLLVVPRVVVSKASSANRLSGRVFLRGRLEDESLHGGQRGDVVAE